MIEILRSSHPFFFIISSCVLTLAFMPGFGTSNFHLMDGHPLFFIHFFPLFVQYLVGLFLLLYSGILINTIVNKSVLFTKNFYLPGLMYISMMLFYPLNNSLHPMVISNFFCILCFGSLIKIYRNESCKNHIFKASCWVLLATLCYPSFAVLFLISWISLLIIRPFVWKEYLIPIISLGFISAYLSAYLLLFEPSFNVIPKWFSAFSFYSNKFNVNIIISVGVFLFVTLGLSLKIIFFSYSHSTNRFKKIMKLLLLYFVLCVFQMGIDVFVFKSNSLSIYSAFVPLSILVSFVFMYGKKLWIVDSIYILFLFSIFLFTYLV